MKKEINLEEILESELTGHMYAIVDDTESMKEFIFDAMLSACKQTLELAAENACINVDSQNKGTLFITIIAGESCETYIEINKQSILETINQIK